MGAEERLAKLRGMLSKTPDDAFLLYALAMEVKKTDGSEAIQLLRRVTQVDPKQCYAYFQIGQIHESAGDTAAAREAYQEGLAAAERFGDAHAKSEIAGAMEMLE